MILNGPQGKSGHFGEEKNLLFPLGMESLLLGFPASSLVAIVTELLCILFFFVSYFGHLG